MKPVDLDELERLHAPAMADFGEPKNRRMAECFPNLMTPAIRDYVEKLFDTAPDLSDELRMRRKQVEEARAAMANAEATLDAVVSDPFNYLSRGSLELVFARRAALRAALKSDHLGERTELTGEGSHD